MVDQIDKIIKKLKDHDKRFDDHDKRFDDHDKRFDKIDQKFSDIDKKLKNHDGKFDRVISKIFELEDKIDQVNSSLTSQIKGSENRILSAVDSFAKKNTDFEIEQVSFARILTRHEDDIIKIKKAIKIT